MATSDGDIVDGNSCEKDAESASTTDPVELAAQVDDFFSTAVQERYAQVPDALAEQLMLHSPYRLVPFVEAYQSGPYPAERLTGLVYRFTEVRLQIEYVVINIGLENQHYYSSAAMQPVPPVSPRLVLTRMALHQAVIGSSRAGWEKLMRSVYFMETGHKELPRTSARSAKTAFFDWAATEDKWRFLTAYRDIVAEHDEKFRTPEYHTNSVLRARIQGRDKVDPDKLLALTNYMQGVIWPNIIAIAGGHQPYVWTDVHRSEGNGFGADPQYDFGVLPPQRPRTAD